MKDCLEWMPDEKNQFHIINKESGDRTKRVIKSRKPFFFLNHVNTFEQSGNLIIDLIGYDSPELIGQMHLEKLRSSDGFQLKDQSQLMRFVIPINPDQSDVSFGNASAKLEKDILWLEPELILTEKGCENPVINPNFRLIKHRFVYATSWLDPNGFFANSLCKIDLDSKSVSSSWRGNQFTFPSQPVFVPSGSEEDSGFLVTPVKDVRENEKDFFVVLDARNLTELARVHFDTDLPMASNGFKI